MIPLQEKLAGAKYQVDICSLSHDYREAVAYNLKRNKMDSNAHVAQASRIYILCLALFPQPGVKEQVEYGVSTPHFK